MRRKEGRRVRGEVLPAERLSYARITHKGYQVSRMGGVVKEGEWRKGEEYMFVEERIKRKGGNRKRKRQGHIAKITGILMSYTRITHEEIR